MWFHTGLEQQRLTQPTIPSFLLMLVFVQLCLTSFFAVVIITKATGGCRSTRNVNKGLSRLISSWPNVASDFRKPSFQHSPHLHLHTEGSLLCPGPPESRYSSYNDIYSVKMTTTGLLLHGKEEATPVPH